MSSYLLRICSVDDNLPFIPAINARNLKGRKEDLSSF